MTIWYNYLSTQGHKTCRLLVLSVIKQNPYHRGALHYFRDHVTLYPRIRPQRDVPLAALVTWFDLVSAERLTTGPSSDHVHCLVCQMPGHVYTLKGHMSIVSSSRAPARSHTLYSVIDNETITVYFSFCFTLQYGDLISVYFRGFSSFISYFINHPLYTLPSE